MSFVQLTDTQPLVLSDDITELALTGPSRRVVPCDTPGSRTGAAPDIGSRTGPSCT